jgi:hypothetical protein
VDERHLGVRTGGVWTSAEAHATGLSPRQVECRVASGQWQVLRRGIYADGGVVPSPQMRAWAAVLAAGGPGRAWATGRTALRLFGLPLIDDEDAATAVYDLPHDDVLVLTRLRARSTLHLSRRAVPVSARGSIAGCPCVSLPHALLAAAAVLTQESLVCALDAALRRQRVTLDELDWPARTRHALPLARAAALADGRAESPLETLGRLALVPVLPDLEPQLEVCDDSGRLLARVDLADRRRRLAVEGDGRSTHTGMAADDHRRDRRIAAYGWATERFTWWDVRRQPEALRQRVLAAARRQEER